MSEVRLELSAFALSSGEESMVLGWSPLILSGLKSMSTVMFKRAGGQYLFRNPSEKCFR